MADTDVLIEQGWKLPAFDIDLQLTVAYVLMAVAAMYLPVIGNTPLHPVLGWGMVLFVPGYALIAVLFPGRKGIDGIERVALSVGLSIAVTPLIGIALNFTPWGINADPIAICLALFTITCTALSQARRNRLPPGERFKIDLGKAYRAAMSEVFPHEKNSLDQALTVILILCILGSITVLAYVITTPHEGDGFTQFYLLGPDRKAYNYSTYFHLGDERPVIVGIINNEHRDVSYDMDIILNDNGNLSPMYSTSMKLADNQTWEQSVPLKPDHVGTNMEIEFLLYADGNRTAPYRELHLWATVSNPVS